MIEFIRICLVEDPEQRPSAQQLLEIDLFNTESII